VYNGLRQLTGEYQANSGAVVTTGPTPTPETQYVYNDPTAGGLQTEMVYPNGRILHYGRNNIALDTAIGRVDYLADDNGSGGVGPHLVDYLYMGTATMVQQADANGVELTYLQQSGDSSAITSGPQYAGDEVTGLDRFGQVVDQNWVNTATPTPTTTDRFQYGYDQDGDVLSSNNLVNSAESELYHSNSTTTGDDNTAYDPLARLTDFERGTLSASENNGGVLDTVSSPSATQSFSLDAVGNQTAVTTDGTTVDNTANSKNELTANGSADLAFDNNGNTTTDESGNTYTFDAWNHIATVKNASGATIATYAYNAAGQRIAETDASATTAGFYYGGSGKIIELRHDSTVTSQNVYNTDYTNDLLVRDDNSTSGNLGVSGSGLGERVFVQHDALCDVTALVNTSGVVVQRFIYSPYGTITVLSPSWVATEDAYNFSFGFQDMWRDPATSLDYTVNRDYDAAIGTWLQPDPIGLTSGSDAYQAFDGSPSDLTDPSGLMPPLNRMREFLKSFEDWLQVVLLGTKVHQVIEENYVDAHAADEPNIHTDNWISTILKDWGGNPAKVNNPRERPDIVQMLIKPLCGYWVYEIKPNNVAGEAAALEEANYYKQQLRAGGLTNVMLGPGGEVGTSGTAQTPDLVLTWSSPADGIILYNIKFKDQFEKAIDGLVAANNAAMSGSVANGASTGSAATGHSGMSPGTALAIGAGATLATHAILSGPTNGGGIAPPAPPVSAPALPSAATVGQAAGAGAAAAEDDGLLEEIGAEVLELLEIGG
jgi:RHS repeat-associated protein